MGALRWLVMILLQEPKREHFLCRQLIKRLSSQVRYTQRSGGSSNSTEILASIVQAVAVLVVNLRPMRTEVFVHLNLRTVNPSNRVGQPFSIPIYVPVMSPYSVKIFSGYQTFENRSVSTL
jgi:hypothetical protein